MARLKVLLDTDIGTDIDDAICLAYLLSNPDCELLGITTVTGEATKRAMIASAVCRALGKEVPIFPGCEQPLLVPQKQKVARQARVLSDWDHSHSFPQGEAIEFMRKTIRAHPGEVVLLGVAPLTNIALLFAVDREIPALLKGIVLMCGNFFRLLPEVSPLEWNACGDPHATAIVYQAPVALHRSLGLDVTTKVTMPKEEFRKVLARIFSVILSLAEVWFEEWGGVTFHDPLAAVTLFDPEVCAFERGTVTVELKDEASRGLTTWQADGSRGRHEVAASVDPRRFFAHLNLIFSRLT